MRFSSFSIIVIFVALMLAGAAFIPRLSVQLHPSATMPGLGIQLSWPNTPAILLEREVTSRLEGALSTLKGVEQVRSTSGHSFGSIQLTFKKGTDIDLMRFEIASQIRRLYPELPQGVSYPLISARRVAGRQNPLLSYSVVAPESSHIIGQYLERSVLPVIAAIKGVDHIDTQGVNSLEFRIVYDTHKMEQWEVSVADLAAAIQQLSGESHFGIQSIHNTSGETTISLPVVMRGGLAGVPEWHQIPVKQMNGRIIYLTDVAVVTLQEQEVSSYYRINGNSTLGLDVFPAAGENQIRLASTLRQRIRLIEQQMPEGWQMLLTYDDTEYISRDLKRVGMRMLFSFSILMVFVLAVTRSMRYLFMILATVMANLLLAAGWYYFLKIDIHLYSLAGITVSFGMIIDNSIVMIEHLRTHRNKQVFVSILAATLTTAGALSVIFMLSEQQQAQLGDFAAVVLVNLLLSLLVAWFFIPAVREKLDIKQEVTGFRYKKRIVRASLIYLMIVRFLRRFRWLVIALLVIGFGLPADKLPSRLEGEGPGVRVYNSTIGSAFYQTKLRRPLEKVLGGSLRLFSSFVFERSYYTDPERTSLRILGRMPDGASVHQLNDAVLQMEAFLDGIEGIEQYQTRVSGYNNGRIDVYFKPEHEHGNFPSYLQGLTIRKAIAIGGAEWNISGVGRGFSNMMSSRIGGDMNLIFRGYNYDQLYRYAELSRDLALKNPRVAGPVISGTQAWARTNRMEFFLSFDERELSLQEIGMRDLYRALAERTSQRQAGEVITGGRSVNVRLVPDSYQRYTVWDFENTPLPVRGELRKPGKLMQLEKRLSGNIITKEDQEYQLYLSMAFQGPHVLQNRFERELLSEINSMLPLGYQAQTRSFGWQPPVNRDYLLILLVIVIIYFICSILLESFLQPLAIIALIPVSFIGLFLTFYLFNLNFDQGGLAAFILLSGLSVNAGLYILNDYNHFCRQFPQRQAIRSYLKAFQYKIFPVLLTITSTLLGLIPFVTGQQEAFWFAFASGTIGGLVFSLPAIILFFPVFLRLGSVRQPFRNVIKTKDINE